jgi:hypothetical protein
MDVTHPKRTRFAETEGVGLLSQRERAFGLSVAVPPKLEERRWARRLGRKGEGTEPVRIESNPSPFFSKLAKVLAREKALSLWERRSRLARLSMWRAVRVSRSSDLDYVQRSS